MSNDTIPLKHCSKCKEELPATQEFFFSHKHGLYGLRSICKACDAKRRREKYADDAEYRERIKGMMRSRYQFNPDVREQQLEQKRNRYANDGDYRESQRRKKLTSEYRTRENELRREKYKTPEGKAIAKSARSRRRTKIIHAEGFHTADDVLIQVCAQTDKKGLLHCWWCGKVIKNYHIDHRIPLARGGTNWPTNIVCSCARCNSSKKDKLCSEWNGRLF